MQRAANRSQRSEVRERRTESIGQGAEDSKQRSEVTGQRAWGMGHGADDSKQRSENGECRGNGEEQRVKSIG